MRRSICQVEPNYSFAGQRSIWRFSFTTCTQLPKGTTIKFDLRSNGIDGEWQLPVFDSKGKKSNLTLEMPEGKSIESKQLNEVGTYLFELPSEVKIGEAITICLGHGKGDNTNQAQTYTQRKRPFHLYIDPKGKSDYKEAEIFSVDVRGNVMKQIRLLVPSLLSKNQRFDLFVRFEDEFGNLTSNTSSENLFELSYDNQRENLNWKLFVPETGYHCLPNLYFNEPGVYRFRLKNLNTKELFESAPIKCISESSSQLLWGSFTGDLTKATQTEMALKILRDEMNLQFTARNFSESKDELAQEEWKQMGLMLSEFNEEGRFASFAAIPWVAETEDEGMRVLVYTKDQKPLFRSKELKSNSLKKIYKSTTSKELFSIPTQTSLDITSHHFTDVEPEFETVAEIYSLLGSTELPNKEGNPFPITFGKKGAPKEDPKGTLVSALLRGVKMGFVAGGRPAAALLNKILPYEPKYYTPGLTAVFATEVNRESIHQAILNRRCYATTGARIVIGFFIAGLPMGCEISAKAKPGLRFNRHIHGYIVGTAPLTNVEILRNGKVIHDFKPTADVLEFEFDDTEPLMKHLLGEERPQCFYYLRIRQKDGHMAWTSPIWIENTDVEIVPKRGRKGS